MLSENYCDDGSSVLVTRFLLNFAPRFFFRYLGSKTILRGRGFLTGGSRASSQRFVTHFHAYVVVIAVAVVVCFLSFS